MKKKQTKRRKFKFTKVNTVRQLNALLLLMNFSKQQKPVSGFIYIVKRKFYTFDFAILKL